MHYALCTIHYTLHIVHYTLHTTHYTLCTIHYALRTIHYKLCTMHCILYTMHYTLCTMHYKALLHLTGGSVQALNMKDEAAKLDTVSDTEAWTLFRKKAMMCICVYVCIYVCMCICVGHRGVASFRRKVCIILHIIYYILYNTYALSLLIFTIAY
jgi:hypothetical protein